MPLTSVTSVIAKKSRWQLQEAKARLSEVVRQACTDGPQIITLRGEDAVVIVSAEQYERLMRRPRTLYEVLRDSPIRPEDVDTIFAREPEIDNRPNPFDFDD
jgi:antitoxin Phd